LEAIEVLELVGRGEDSRTQFKLNITSAESLSGELVAFSNSRGGRIMVGVDNQGVIVGLRPEDVRRLNQLISNASTNNVHPSINPETDNVMIGEKLVMVITVAEGISKPYSDSNGVFWVKSGSDKRRVTSREEIQRMLQSADLVHADEVPVEGTTVSDIDLRHFDDYYAKQYGKTRDEVESPPVRLLNNLGLARNEQLVLAGLMLFGHHPQRYRPAFVVKAVAYDGKDPAGDKYRDSQDIEGCLRDMYAGTMGFLSRNLRRIQDGKGFNTEGDLEVPPQTLEELVVNMFVHRDYFISAPWRIMLFDDRIEIISPGALPNNLTVENIRNGVSNFRNPLLGSFATKELPYRGIGSGIRRAVALVPDLELISDPERNLFVAKIPRHGQ